MSFYIPGGGNVGSGSGSALPIATGTDQELVSQDNQAAAWISHLLRPQAYRAFVNDGVTDNTTVMQQMFTDAQAGRGLIQLPNSKIFSKNLPAFKNMILDGNGAELAMPAGAVSTDWIIQALNFNTNSVFSGGPGNATVSGGTVPYGFKISNLWLSNVNGGNLLGLYAYDFDLNNIRFYQLSTGFGLWSEYGTTAESFQSGTTLFGVARAQYRDLRFFDSPSGANCSLIPNNTTNAHVVSITNVTNTINPTITTNKSHFLSPGMTIQSISGVVGSTGVNGTNWIVLATPAFNQFTITTAAPGAYTSGGTVTWVPSACWANLGPHDAFYDMVTMAASSHVNGRIGLALGSNGNASSTGFGGYNIHVYDNWDIAVLIGAGNAEFSTGAQFEGSTKCVVKVQHSGQPSLEGSKIFGGSGGCVLLYWDSGVNQGIMTPVLFSAGSGSAPPAGYDNCYVENYGNNWGKTYLSMQHGFATSKTLTRGTPPAGPWVVVYDDFGGNVGVTPGWSGIGQIDATHWYGRSTGDLDSNADVIIATGGTISLGPERINLAPVAAVTGVILALPSPAATGTQDIFLMNNSAFSITFAIAATSHVADGTSDVIAANTAAHYVFSVLHNLWFRCI